MIEADGYETVYATAPSPGCEVCGELATVGCRSIDHGERSPDEHAYCHAHAIACVASNKLLGFETECRDLNYWRDRPELAAI